MLLSSDSTWYSNISQEKNICWYKALQKVLLSYTCWIFLAVNIFTHLLGRMCSPVSPGNDTKIFPPWKFTNLWHVLQSKPIFRVFWKGLDASFGDKWCLYVLLVTVVMGTLSGTMATTKSHRQFAMSWMSPLPTTWPSLLVPMCSVSRVHSLQEDTVAISGLTCHQESIVSSSTFRPFVSPSPLQN